MNPVPFKNRSSEFPGDLPCWARANAPDNSSSLAGMRRNLHSAREQELTPRQRELLRLYYDKGINMVEIAKMLDINPSTVSRTIARARGRLNRCLRYTV